MTHATRDFMGAKLALFIGDRLLTLHRDDKPRLLWAGCWDLPGGGREAGENPLETALRETREEFGLTVPPAQVRWGRACTNSIGRTVWFFVGHVPARMEREIVFGDEGQGWALMTREAFDSHPKVVPHFKQRLADYYLGVCSDYKGFFGKAPR